MRIPHPEVHFKIQVTRTGEGIVVELHGTTFRSVKIRILRSAVDAHLRTQAARVEM
jgi:hypothetical protein